MGGIRVDRGTGSDEPLQAAADALEGGEMVAMMPEGTIPRGPAFFTTQLIRTLGRCPARPDVRCHRDPGRAVGHGECVAAVESRPEGAEPHRPAHRA